MPEKGRYSHSKRENLERGEGSKQVQYLARQIPLVVRFWEQSSLVQCAACQAHWGVSATFMVLWSNPVPRYWAITLLLRYWWHLGSLLPNQRDFAFWNWGRARLVLWTCGGSGSLPISKSSLGSVSPFLKDKSCLKLGTSMVSFCRILEVLQLSYSIPFFFFFPVPFSVSAGWISAAIIQSLCLASAEMVDLFVAHTHTNLLIT